MVSREDESVEQLKLPDLPGSITEAAAFSESRRSCLFLRAVTIDAASLEYRLNRFGKIHLGAQPVQAKRTQSHYKCN